MHKLYIDPVGNRYWTKNDLIFKVEATDGFKTYIDLNTKIVSFEDARAKRISGHNLQCATWYYEHLQNFYGETIRILKDAEAYHK